MSPGDVVLIRFPQVDLTEGKLRPALVLAVAPGRHEDLLLAMVTSRVYQAVADFDEVIESAAPDFESTGLKVTSCIRLARLITVTPSTINAKLGQISTERLQTIRSRLASWMESTPAAPE